GAARSDAVLLAQSHIAAAAGDQTRLLQLAELAAALQPSHERRVESVAQGAAFRRVAIAAAACPQLDMLQPLDDDSLAYPVVVGVLAAGHRIPLIHVLTAYLHSVAGNLVSAAQRLIPLGQTDAQIVIAELEGCIGETVEFASSLT